jgi:bacillopeptidase F
MWNLGYTGLGRKLFTCDTGVWPVHPAIKRQFRGNYLPESWCWKGFDSETPADKPDAHGTHVTGTVLGLDTLTADTIGVAFNASYIAADPIVEDAADIKPVSVIFEAFQFAINPDGNDLTSNDVPDVICMHTNTELVLLINLSDCLSVK